MGILVMTRFSPMIMITCTIMVIISLSLKKKSKLKKFLFVTGCSVAVIYVFILFAIVIPYTFISGMFEDYTGILLMLIIIFVVWGVVSLIINFKNKFTFYKKGVKDIYIRDIDVKYSPAVVSYLMNNKTETKKDLMATLLNLCASNIIKIEKDDDTQNINIIDLKNSKEVIKLTEDERYAYEMFIDGITNSKINIWKNKVKEEYKKHRLSKENETPLGAYIMWLYVTIFILIFLYMIITGEFTITGKLAEIIAGVIVATFMGAWEMIVLAGFKTMLNELLKNNNSSSFKDIYTNKGAKEYTRWKKFEKFIEDFSLINEREHESVILWGKYLAYAIALGINKKRDKELYNKIEKEYKFNFDFMSNIFEEFI